MQPYDPLRLDRAIALGRDTFCVVFSGKEYEDMYSYVLVHEGGLEQPWSRSDIPGKIDGLTGKMGEDGRPIIYALAMKAMFMRYPWGRTPRIVKSKELASIPTMRPTSDTSTP
ncbi:hypothetical protein [Rhizobium leguminosarum]|uniref:hypothetical protein n=1 Tax=Rhizobium leguminosarum TaxID=384 RepID=UPI000371008F|nr:hypothetical protein [Rhizobium leguminosarum]MBY5795149.1 hypothetical protein [Rhizobium leguminosarum]